MPTACALGKRQAVLYIGWDFIPANASWKGNQTQHDYLYLSFTKAKGHRLYVKASGKLWVEGVKSKNPAALELYDLENDPAEKNNIANQYPEISAEMSSMIKKAHVPSKVFALPTDIQLVPLCEPSCLRGLCGELKILIRIFLKPFNDSRHISFKPTGMKKFNSPHFSLVLLAKSCIVLAGILKKSPTWVSTHLSPTQQ
jgi:hypothetical protein